VEGKRKRDRGFRKHQGRGDGASKVADSIPADVRRLQASREVTQLIFSAEKPESLVGKTCRTLVETLGYSRAWIALLDAEGPTVIRAVASGYGDDDSVMRERLESGGCAHRMRDAARRDGVHVMRGRASECGDCPLAASDWTCARIVSRLAVGDRIYGVVTAFASSEDAPPKEELAFFDEIVRNTAFALHGLEQDRALRLATQIVNSSPTVAFIWETDERWSVRYVSENVERLLGYAAEDFVSGRMVYADVIHPVDRPRVRAETDEACKRPGADKVEHETYRVVTQAGDVKWVEDMTTIERSSEGAAMSLHGLLLDVTERIEARRLLKQSRDFLESLVNAVGEPIFVKDVNHRWIALNDAFCEMFGRTREEMLGKSDSDFFPPEEVEIFWAHDDRALAADGACSGEMEISGLTGRRIISTIKSAFTDPTTGQRVLVGTIRDITERVTAERALRESEAALRQAQRIAKLGSWRVDVATQRLTASEELQEIFQIPEHLRAGLMVGDWMKGVHPDDVERVSEARRRARDALEPLNMEYRIVRDDGEIRTIHAHGEYVLDDEGRPVEVVGTAQDVTEQRQAQEELRESQIRLRSIFDQTYQFAGIIGLDGVLLDANRASLSFIDATEAGVVGRPFWETPWWIHDLAQQEWLRRAISEATRGESQRREVTHVSSDGELHYFDFTLKPVTSEDGRPAYLIAESRDVTERRLAEERTRSLLNRQVAINELSAALGDKRDLQGTYRTIHQHVARMLDVETFTISWVDLESGDLTTAFAVAEGTASDDPEACSIDMEERALLERVVTSGEALRVDGRSAPALPEATQAGSALIAPLKVEGTVVGVMQVRSRRELAYSDESRDLLAGLANVAAIAIENSRLHEKSLADAAELRAAFRGTIETLARATESRDPYTAGHQLRVAQLSTEIAEVLGLNDERVERVRIAAMVHDIGKLSIPAEILNRPGRLSEVEMSLVQEHPKGAYEILKTIDFPWPVAEIVLQHHERLDGTGYPNGLYGEEIELEARILAVADVVEAMSSHRPYRPALGAEAALAEIEAHAGTHYDRAVVKACLAAFAERDFAFDESVVP